MTFFLRPGLTLDDASHICMQECRAMCCRGPLVLDLGPEEVGNFLEYAEELGIEAQVTVGAGEKGWLKFADHEGEKCPMLDPDSLACRIYTARPRRCREFPEKLTPGCLISGG